MGCGHSKINIYKKYKNKANSKHLVAHHEVVPKEENDIETESESPQKLDDSDQKKTVKVKAFSGSLLAQAEISSSQQEFFRMLDEKIQNGPDYNSDSETERAAETQRINALLRDWETASSGSRSLSVTPKRHIDGVISTTETTTEVDASRIPPVNEVIYKPQISQSIVQQSYGIPQANYLQSHYNNSNYLTKNPSYPLSYSPALQYQAISPVYNSTETNYQPSGYQLRQYPNYNQYGSPIKTYVSSSPSSHIPYEPPKATYSPTHRLYGPLITVPSNKEKTENEVDYNTYYVNTEIHQPHQQSHQVFNHHPGQYHQQYKEAREQVLAQHQQHNSFRGPQKTYQSNVSNPLLMKERLDMNSLHKKQYELT